MRNKIDFLALLWLALSLLVVACGDDTPVPASSTTPQGTASGTRTAGAGASGTAANPPAGGSQGGNGTVTAANGSPLSRTTAAAVSIPTYPGATKLNSVAGGVSGASGAVETYKTADGPDKVKTFYNDFFSKNSWQIQTNINNPYSSVLGNTATALAYSKNNQSALVLIATATDAARLGITGTNNSDTVILVVQGKI